MCVMTTHPDPHRPSALPELISGPDELLAAIPAFLGFTPHRSIVLVCLDGRESSGLSIGTVMRHDVTLPQSPDGDVMSAVGVTAEMAEVSAHFASICARNEVRGALALIVDDRARPRAEGAAVDRRIRSLASRLAHDLSERGTDLLQVFVVSELTAGTRWWVAFGPFETGILPDPATSPVALAYLLEGRGVHESRDKLKEALAAVDTAVSRDVEAWVAVKYMDEPGPDRGPLTAILSQFATWAAAPPDRPAVVHLSAEKIAEYGVWLTRVMVRDSLLAIALTGFADIAEQLWSYLMRLLPPAERACPATLLGFSAYARGEGALAAVAIDIALDADPEYSLARLLDRSLLAGARPEMIREVALSGYAIAELCAVELPPPIE